MCIEWLSVGRGAANSCIGFVSDICPREGSARVSIGFPFSGVRKEGANLSYLLEICSCWRIFSIVISVRDLRRAQIFVFMGTKCAEIKQESCIIGFLVSVGEVRQNISVRVRARGGRSGAR